MVQKICENVEHVWKEIAVEFLILLKKKIEPTFNVAFLAEKYP